MDPEIIALIIKWGPLALVGVTFIYFFVVGVIRGTYKVMRRLIYVLLYVSLVFIFIDSISNFILDLNITINGVQGVRNFIVQTIESNEEVNKFLGYSPELKMLVIDSPEIILNPILFIVLVFIGLPLSLPIYWIYLIFWHIIMKLVFKRQKYEKDEDGNILRNDKGKKIKVRRKKRRLLGGLIRGVQGVVLICISLLPVNFVNRLYNRAKNTADLDDGETLCSSIEGAEFDESICKYLDIYNETIFAKLGGEKSLDRFVSDGLTSVKVNGEKVVLEDELGSIVETVVLINDSGLLKLLMSGEIDLETFDWNSINLDKINQAIDKLFGSYLISRVSEAGVRYVLNEVVNDKLVEVLKDDDIVSKLEYSGAQEIKEELQNLVSILQVGIDKGVVQLVVNNRDNLINIVNGIENGALETLLNKVLSIRILTKAMPSVIKAYGEEYGVNVPSSMTSELNNEIVSTFVNTVKFVKTLELTSLEELTEGDIVENLTTALFKNGALKSNSKDSLATLLHNINSSYLFKDVVSEQTNKLLKDKDYKIDARVLKYVDSKESWLKELDVLEDAFAIYDEYNNEETIHYEKVTDLLNDLGDTKVLISILPFAYDELLPQIGIEVDTSKLPSIDFGEDSENSSKLEFYKTWEDELKVLQNIAQEARVLELQSLEDISVDVLKEDTKVEALSAMVGEIYKSELLKEPFVLFFVDTVNEFVEDYDVEFTKEELLSIDTKDKWKNEFTNINNVLEIDFSNEDNITSSNLEIVFDSIGNMKLFETKKIEMLKYAVDMSDFLTEQEYNSIVWPSDDATQEEINAFYNNETGILVNIVDKKDTIENLANDSIEDMDTDEIGELLNEVMDSSILSPIVVNKISSLLVDNGVKDDRDEGSSTTNLKNSIVGVSDWREELGSIKELVNSTNDISVTTYHEIVAESRYNKDGESYSPNPSGSYLKVGENYYFIDNEYLYKLSGDEYVKDEENGTHLKVTETKVDELFAAIEESDLLKNSRANLLLKAVETIDIVEVPSSVTVITLKENNYEDYNKEKNVIVEVSKKKNVFDNVSTMNLETIDVDEIGGLLDTVSTSDIFKPYLVSEIRKVFVSNDVKDDRDEDGSVVNLENSIGSVTSWSKELGMIQDMLTMSEDTFNSNVEVSEGVYKTRVEVMFDNIEESDLLKNSRANLLLKAVKTIDIVEVPNTVTVDTLRAEEYKDYNVEKDVVIEVGKNKNLFDGVATMDLKTIDTTEIGSLLDTIYKSKIFKPHLVGEIRKVFVSNDVRDDRDEGVSVTNLENSIGNVSSWSKELSIIQDMLTITGDTFDSRVEVSEGVYKTRVEIMFDNIENSELLRNTRANLLIKAVSLINLDGVNTSTVTVASLSAKQNDEEYYQYNREVDVFVTFAENIDAVNDLKDITTLNDENKVKMGNVLDAMKYSEILKDKYVWTIEKALEVVSGNATLGESGYDIKFKGRAETNDYKDIVWSNEINNLTTIQKNIEKVSEYDMTSLTTPKDRENTLKTIGETLDAIEQSNFLYINSADPNVTPADKIADAVVTKLTEGLPEMFRITHIDKGGYDTWQDAFDAKIPSLH